MGQSRPPVAPALTSLPRGTRIACASREIDLRHGVRPASQSPRGSRSTDRCAPYRYLDDQSDLGPRSRRAADVPRPERRGQRTSATTDWGDSPTSRLPTTETLLATCIPTQRFATSWYPEAVRSASSTPPGARLQCSPTSARPSSRRLRRWSRSARVAIQYAEPATAVAAVRDLRPHSPRTVDKPISPLHHPGPPTIRPRTRRFSTDLRPEPLPTTSLYDAFGASDPTDRRRCRRHRRRTGSLSTTSGIRWTTSGEAFDGHLHTTRTDGHGRVIDQVLRPTATGSTYRLYSTYRADGAVTQITRAEAASDAPGAAVVIGTYELATVHLRQCRQAPRLHRSRHRRSRRECREQDLALPLQRGGRPRRRA